MPHYSSEEEARQAERILNDWQPDIQRLRELYRGTSIDFVDCEIGALDPTCAPQQECGGNFFSYYRHATVNIHRRERNRRHEMLGLRQIEEDRDIIIPIGHLYARVSQKKDFQVESSQLTTILMDCMFDKLRHIIMGTPGIGAKWTYRFNAKGITVERKDERKDAPEERVTLSVESRSSNKVVIIEIRAEGDYQAFAQDIPSLFAAGQEIWTNTKCGFSQLEGDDIIHTIAIFENGADISSNFAKKLANLGKSRHLVGNFYFDTILGKPGGFGFVAKVFKPNNPNPFALKVIPLRDEIAIASAYAEIDAQKKFSHENIVRFDDNFWAFYHLDFQFQQFWQTTTPVMLCACIEMDYIPGQNLQEMIQSEQGKKPNRFQGVAGFALLQDIANALQALAKQGNCHRDLSARNIMIKTLGVDRDKAILIDLSLARYVNINHYYYDRVAKDQGVTKFIGKEVGSFAYYPLEATLGDDADKTSIKFDCYSLGVVFYQMLYGKLPSVQEKALQMPLDLLFKGSPQFKDILFPEKLEDLKTKFRTDSSYAEQFLAAYYSCLELKKDERCSPAQYDILCGLLHPLAEYRWGPDELIAYLPKHAQQDNIWQVNNLAIQYVGPIVVYPDTETIRLEVASDSVEAKELAAKRLHPTDPLKLKLTRAEKNSIVKIVKSKDRGDRYIFECPNNKLKSFQWDPQNSELKIGDYIVKEKPEPKIEVVQIRLQIGERELMAKKRARDDTELTLILEDYLREAEEVKFEAELRVSESLVILLPPVPEDKVKIQDQEIGFGRVDAWDTQEISKKDQQPTDYGRILKDTVFHITFSASVALKEPVLVVEMPVRFLHRPILNVKVELRLRVIALWDLSTHMTLSNGLKESLHLVYSDKKQVSTKEHDQEITDVKAVEKNSPLVVSFSEFLPAIATSPNTAQEGIYLWSTLLNIASTNFVMAGPWEKQPTIFWVRQEEASPEQKTMSWRGDIFKFSLIEDNSPVPPWPLEKFLAVVKSILPKFCTPEGNIWLHKKGNWSSEVAAACFDETDLHKQENLHQLEREGSFPNLPMQQIELHEIPFKFKQFGKICFFRFHKGAQKWLTYETTAPNISIYYR